MQLQEQYQRDSNSITHSPYYGCTVRVVSKVQVSYEGILDGISINKDRIFLKNVRVKGNIINSSNRANTLAELDTFNSVMIDHLTNDMHIYEQVCLNVRDIQELKLIRLPATFHESQAKLRAIDPCLLDIRLSPSDQHERMSNESLDKYSQPTPIARRVRGESLGSNGGSALVSSSSNESSSSFGYRPDELFDEHIEKFSRLSTTTTTANVSPKPATLLAKKILPKKIERNQLRPSGPETTFGSTSMNNSNILKIVPLPNHRRASPIRVTITSKLNPNAVPFYGQQQQQRSTYTNQNSTLKFYERNPFQPMLSADRSRGTGNPSVQQTKQPPPHHHNHQRFIPPRQMAIKKHFDNHPSSPAHYRVDPSTSSYLNKRVQPQQQAKYKTASHEQIPGLMSQSSSVTDSIFSTPPRRERLSVSSYNHSHRSPNYLHSTGSLPYQTQNLGDLHQVQRPLSYSEPIGSHRGQRTISGTSSGSSMSTDIGPHSIVQLDSSANVLSSLNEQYDFEKANEEFRRYLELEELVTGGTSSACSISSHPDDNSNQQQSQSHSYKKDISFFDRISCTATTGTAVAYAEMDEVEKNLETFGEDALLITSDSGDHT